jgi:flavin reductase (DIM6/NTAB) family NADH-FMN oxidoreductase RutF
MGSQGSWGLAMTVASHFARLVFAMAKRLLENIRISLYPKAVVVVTSVNNQGQIGATTIAWNGILSSRPPVVGVSFLPDSFTRSCIVESREFVINVPDSTYWKEVNYLGSLSGPWTEKMQPAPPATQALTLAPSNRIRSPRIDECYLNLECQLLDTHQLGLYDCLLGIVLAMHCDDGVFLDSHPKGGIDQRIVQPIICMGDEYWSNGHFLGHSTENKNHPHGREH